MVLADLSIKRPVMMTMAIFALVVIGLFSLVRLGIDLMPKIDFPFISVVTVYPGAGPEEIETLINEPLEEEISSVGGVKNVFSTAQEGVSVVAIELQVGEDIDIAAIDVKDKIDAVRRELPDDIEEPVVQKFEAGASAIISLAVSGERPLDEIYRTVDQLVRPELLKISGVATVEVTGRKEREIRLELSSRLMRAYNISPMQVVMALGSQNLTLPAGRIERGRSEYTLRMSGEFADVDAIRATRIMTPSGPIRLDRIGEVKDDFAEMRELARFNQSRTIGLNVIKRTDANTVQVADEVYAALDRLEGRMPAQMQIDIANDFSTFIRDSVADVRGNLVMGILFTAIVLFLFLHNWRGTLIAAVAMPISIVSTFTLLWAAGFTINVISLMGLAVSIGILVVNAVVVLENIERLREEGMSLRDAASKGTAQIAVAVAAATLTNVVVFTPMAFMQGIIGSIFQQFGLTVAFATIVSLLVSFTLTPMMASRPLKAGVYIAVGGLTLWASFAFLGLTWGILVAAAALLFALLDRTGMIDRFSRFWNHWYGELASDYRVGLQWSLDHRGLVLGGVLLIFIVGVGLFGFIGSEFFPGYDERSMLVSVEMPAGSRLEETNKVLLRIEQEIAEYDEVESIYTSLGSSNSSGFGAQEGVQYGNIVVNLRDTEEAPEGVSWPPTLQVVKQLRVSLADIPAADITVSEQQQMGSGGGQADLQIELQGDNMDALDRAAQKLVELVESTGNAVNVRSDWVVGKPEIVVEPDRSRLSERGVSVQQVAMELRSLFEGMVATQYREGGEEYDVRVQLREEDRNSIELVQDLLVATPQGMIPLKEIAEISIGSGPTQVTRKNKQRLVTVSANTANVTPGELQVQVTELLELPQRPASEVMSDILSGTSSVAPRPSPQLPDGVTVYYGGEAEMMADSFSSLLQALVLAVILTYMLLSAILESYRFPWIIMMTLPLALVGVSMSLVMTGMTISIMSMMSMVMLVGIVVNNGILLIDYTQELRREGRDLDEAILEACPVRLRPILMSTLATALGMLPLALGFGAGGEFRQPMAVVAIGGLLVSMTLTLFVIPVTFQLMESRSEASAARRLEQNGSAEGDLA